MSAATQRNDPRLANPLSRELDPGEGRWLLVSGFFKVRWFSSSAAEHR
jgi:hypothetical protein